MYIKFENDQGEWMVPFTNITGFLVSKIIQVTYGGGSRIYGILYGNDQHYDINSREEIRNVREQLEKEWNPVAEEEPPAPPPPPPPPAPDGPEAIIMYEGAMLPKEKE